MAAVRRGVAGCSRSSRHYFWRSVRPSGPRGPARYELEPPLSIGVHASPFEPCDRSRDLQRTTANNLELQPLVQPVRPLVANSGRCGHGRPSTRTHQPLGGRGRPYWPGWLLYFAAVWHRLDLRKVRPLNLFHAMVAGHQCVVRGMCPIRLVLQGSGRSSCDAFLRVCGRWCVPHAPRFLPPPHDD